MDIVEAKRVLAEVKFPGFSFLIHNAFADGEPTYLQAAFDAFDNDRPGVIARQLTRKWLLSRHMTRSELVQTAFKCVLTSVEHETREQFTYKGARVFGPHFDVEGLVQACKAGWTEKREEGTAQ
ncbi:MAG: hypothetical protein KF740_19890 [Ramlibacter sp.]|nr:hypothetical protein [Ramlibacter sp.]